MSEFAARQFLPALIERELRAGPIAAVRRRVRSL
jgi:hypothetical protein